MNLFQNLVTKKLLLGEMISDFSGWEDLSDDEFDIFIANLPSDLTLESFEKLVVEFDESHPALILSEESQSTERRRELRIQDKTKKDLGSHYYAPKSASRDARIHAAANRASVFKWNKTTKRWTPRKKRLDANKIKIAKISRSNKYKSSGTAKKASRRAANLRVADTSKGPKLGKLLDLSKKGSGIRRKT